MKPCTIARFVFLALALPALMVSTAHADDKFTQMDANKDGKVTWEEFHKTYPQMQQAAFDGIDADKDKVLSHEEWDTFLAQHSMGRAAAPGAMGGGMGGAMPPKAMPDSPKTDGAPRMITPPAK